MNKHEWSLLSPEEEGFHAIFEAGKSACKVLSFYRLNLAEGNSFSLETGGLEMNFVLVGGSVTAEFGLGKQTLACYDSFYVPGKTTVSLQALEDAILYVPAAPCEGFGKPFLRKYMTGLPVGDIYQVHGTGASQREVYFTLNAEVPASRLLCGFAFGGEGSWTSWPPHQHSAYLEEAYCYFGMGNAYSGYQLCYSEPGGIGGADKYLVKSGSIITIPEGYHPTVSFPGSRNTYLWVMASFAHECRRYDLAEPDPFIPAEY